MLQSAMQLSANTNPDDEEMVDYNNELRNGIFEAYAGILQGLKLESMDASKLNGIREHVPFVVDFIEAVSKDPNCDSTVTRSMVGVLGDIANCFRGVGPVFAQKPFWNQFLSECASSPDDALRRDAAWARDNIQERMNEDR